MTPRRAGSRRRKAARLLPVLGRLPERLVDDPQFGAFGRDPLLRRVEARDAPAGIRILLEALAVPDQPAGVERIVDDAVLAQPRAADGRRVPDATARAGNALGVQPSRDLAGRPAVDILAQNPHHDGCLLAIDLQLTLAAMGRPIPIGAAAGGKAFTHDSLQTPMGLGGEVAQIERAHQPGDANMDVVGAAALHCADLDTEMPKALEDVGEVFLVAGDAVQRFRDDYLKRARPGVTSQLGERQTVDCRCAGEGAIGVSSSFGQPFTGNKGLT